MTSIAWAAGFYEGEGTCGCYSKGASRPFSSLQMAIGQTDPEPLEKFLAAVGLGRITGPFHYSKMTRKPMWFYRTRKVDEMITVMCRLWPWLSRRRKDQFATAMRKWRGY